MNSLVICAGRAAMKLEDDQLRKKMDGISFTGILHRCFELNKVVSRQNKFTQ